MDTEQPLIRISVRNLVEFILRSGDIDNRAAGADKDAMLLGGKIHRKIQRSMGADYQAEVSLKMKIPCQGFDLSVEGRADGIFRTPSGIVVDEIKGIFKDLEYLKEPEPIHLAQAKCYAYIYAVQQELEEIGVQMTYCNMDTEDIKRFQSAYQTKELGVWFLEVVGEYEKWARFQIRWQEKRNASIREVQFPFAYREGQKKLTAAVYRTIEQKKKLFIQAPTGVGKTIATVFPAVRAMGEGLGEKIFYLTAKTITRTVAWQAFETLREQALRMKVIVLTAKEKICFCEETECNPDACPYAKGHFDRVNDAVYELLNTTDAISREVIEEQARKWQVCPFEMGLDVSTWVDAVICDYNYVFDPNVRLKRFFAEGTKGEYLFLIDEAHNLVERGREMFSASLCKEDFLELKRKLKGRYKKAERCLERCNKYLLGLKKECETYQLHEDVGAFALQLLSLSTELDRIREEGAAEPELLKEILDFWFQVRDFLNTVDRLDENYVIYSELGEDGRFRLKLYCVETAKNLRECLDKGNAAVFFSATLLPMPYYKHLLGDGEDYAVYARSPFAAENRLLLLGQDVSSRYTRRNQTEYERIAAWLAAMAEGRRGNYLAFFPSYRMMGEVFDIFEERYGKRVDCVIQRSGMREEEREAFLRQFEQDGTAGQAEGSGREKSLLGFCVLGGIFSEGIDLKREALIGAAVVGTGLPQVCHEREILRRYYEERGMDGFAYAYRYPGMNKVLQAAGRVIRTDEDRGVILLLDDRFLSGEYRRLFPLEWEGVQACRLGDAGGRIESFWEGAGQV